MRDLMDMVDRWETGRAEQRDKKPSPSCEKSEISEKSQGRPHLISLISQPEEAQKTAFEGFEGSTSGRSVSDGDTSSKYEPEPLKPSIPPVEVSPDGPNLVAPLCVCDEKPYPHFRHRDGSGPGSGRALDPYDLHQAHRSRRVE